MDDTVIWIIGGMLVISKIIDMSTIRREMERTNLNLDKIAKHIGLFDEAVDKIDTELRSLIADGKRIKAVKRYREVTGHGLKESKEYIDSLISDGRKK